MCVRIGLAKSADFAMYWSTRGSVFPIFHAPHSGWPAPCRKGAVTSSNRFKPGSKRSGFCTTCHRPASLKLLFGRCFKRAQGFLTAGWPGVGSVVESLRRRNGVAGEPTARYPRHGAYPESSGRGTPTSSPSANPAGLLGGLPCSPRCMSHQRPSVVLPAALSSRAFLVLGAFIVWSCGSWDRGTRSPPRGTSAT